MPAPPPASQDSPVAVRWRGRRSGGAAVRTTDRPGAAPGSDVPDRRTRRRGQGARESDQSWLASRCGTRWRGRAEIVKALGAIGTARCPNSTIYAANRKFKVPGRAEPVRGIDMMSVGGRWVSSTKVSVGGAVRRSPGAAILELERRAQRSRVRRPGVGAARPDPSLAPTRRSGGSNPGAVKSRCSYALSAFWKLDAQLADASRRKAPI